MFIIPWIQRCIVNANNGHRNNNKQANKLGLEIHKTNSAGKICDSSYKPMDGLYLYAIRWKEYHEECDYNAELGGENSKVDTAQANIINPTQS